MIFFEGIIEKGKKNSYIFILAYRIGWVGRDTMANFDGSLKYDNDIFSPSIHGKMHNREWVTVPGPKKSGTQEKRD